MSAAPPGVAGLLLTGGRSSRMGRDKASLLHPDGTTFAARAGRQLAAVACPALEVGPGRSGLLAVDDDTPGDGPLAAVAAGWRRLRALGSEWPALVLACDLPLLSSALLERVASWPGGASVVPLVDDRPQWCCARYSPACLRRAAGLVAGGRRDLAALGQAAGEDEGIVWLGAAELGESLRLLVDADTPEDLDSLDRTVSGAAAVARPGHGARAGGAGGGGPLAIGGADEAAGGAWNPGEVTGGPLAAVLRAAREELSPGPPGLDGLGFGTLPA